MHDPTLHEMVNVVEEAMDVWLAPEATVVVRAGQSVNTLQGRLLSWHEMAMRHRFLICAIAEVVLPTVGCGMRKCNMPAKSWGRMWGL